MTSSYIILLLFQVQIHSTIIFISITVLTGVYHCFGSFSHAYGQFHLTTHGVHYKSYLNDPCIMRRPHMVGHYAMKTDVCPSVCSGPDPKPRTEAHIKLKIGKREAHDTNDPRPH